MASRQFIPPFPPEIDRCDFGHWLSGFVDGEGCFRLAHCKEKHDPTLFRSGFGEFAIALRSDDRPILEQIQSFFGCGYVRDRPRFPARDGGVNPGVSFNVSRVRDLATILVPHFEQYPLHAKKSRDFLIWRRGVELLYRVKQKPRKTRGSHTYGCGQMPSWTPEEKAEFAELMNSLKAQRRYKAPPLPEPPPMPPQNGHSQLPLFD